MKRFLHIHFLLIFSVLLVSTNQTLLKGQSSGKTEDTNFAHQLLDEVVAADKFITRLDSLLTIDLPVGIGVKGMKEAEKYAIVISKITVLNGETFFDAYMAFTIPGTTKKIAFKGTDIPFSFTGGIFDEARLELVSDFDVRLSGSISLVLKGKGKSSVTMDCNGFKQMDISADVLFDSTLLVPENPDGTLKKGALRTSFQTTITDWNNLLIGVTLEPFQLKSIKGVGFSVNNAVLDLSDFRNPNGIAFSSRHRSDYFIGANRDIWQGTYIQDVQVRLPQQFRKKTQKELDKDQQLAEKDSTYKFTDSIATGRTTFYSQNILIDELGFTGRLAASHIMRLEEGDMNNWNFSVENFLIDIQANELLAGQFSGQILVPKFKINQVFDYTATIGLNGTYAFVAGITDTMSLPIWAADIRIEPNSQIIVAVKKDVFSPGLYLNGELKINAPTDKNNKESSKLALAKIPFQGMRIQTEKPHFSVEQVSFGTKQNNFAKFPVGIHKVNIVNKDNRTGLALGLNVHFTKPNAGGFSGLGEFTIWGKEEHNDWKYDGVQVDRIAVDISKGDKFRLAGQVIFMRGNKTFGDGFRGDLEATFGNFEMGATAVFGNVNDYRYWFADAIMVKKSGIKAGPVALYSFSGGAYYHVAPNFKVGGELANIGRSQTGIVYTPNKTRGLNIKAASDFGLSGKPEALNGNARFEMNFTTSGGFKDISFEGNAYFMVKDFEISKEKLVERTRLILKNSQKEFRLPVEADKAQIYGNIFMKYDHPNKTFHANFDIYANIKGGKIKGIGPQNKAGWGSMHFAPDDWYIHLGTPEQPNGIEVLNLAKIEMYFMTGKSIPELPPPPIEVMECLNTTKEDYKSFEGASQLMDGRGFALGGEFSFDTGERTALMFYGRLSGGFGFDILLKDYGKATCESRSGSLGINGWYAQGQAYAWLAADIGLKVDLPFIRGKYSILDFQAAALLQAKLPNPLWMKGQVGGDYKLLGGKIKGHCDFGFEIGEKCEIVSGSPLGGVKVIGDISPVNSEEDVSVFATPQVVFNFPVDEVFELEDHKHRKKFFKIKLKKLDVTTGAGTPVAGTISWNDRHDVVAFKPFEVLPGQENIKVYAEVTFEERINNVWYNIGEESNENKETAFKTGKRPPYIDPNNITYSYPMKRGFNYYQKEEGKNYIQLSSGQEYLFEPGSEWVQKVKLTALSTGKKRYVDVTYAASAKRVSFALPQNLSNNTVYRMDIVNVPTSKASAIDNNVEQETETVQVGDENNSSVVEIATQHAEGDRTELQEKSIYSMEFRTSHSNSLEDKIGKLRKSDGVSWELYPLVHSLTVNILGERFDNYEVENLQTGMAISVEPILEETNWYQKHMLPIIGLTDSELQAIYAEPFSVNPLTSYFFQSDGTRGLTDLEIENGRSNDIEVLSGMKYYLAKYVCEYQAYLKGQVANYGSSLSKNRAGEILNSHFIPLKYGDYPVQIHYTLPGEEEPVKSFKYIIKYLD